MFLREVEVAKGLFSQVIKLTQVDFRMTQIKLCLISACVFLVEEEKSLLCKELRFSIPSKRLIKLIGNFLKNKLKDICFSTLKYYSFEK